MGFAQTQYGTVSGQIEDLCGIGDGTRVVFYLAGIDGVDDIRVHFIDRNYGIGIIHLIA